MRPFIQDAYSDTRGGQSVWLNLFCAHCGEFVGQYQKDFGAPEHSGPLYRGYVDRFVKPEAAITRWRAAASARKLEPLDCTGCSARIGTPITYERENRPAFEFERAAVIKQRLDGSEFEPVDIHES